MSEADIEHRDIEPSEKPISKVSKVKSPKAKTPKAKVKNAAPTEQVVVDKKVCADQPKNDSSGGNQPECPIKEAGAGTGSATAAGEGSESNDSDRVNIVIKSCKNITSKQALLVIPITKYFSVRGTLNKLISILKGESVSLRLIDWFATNYCKKFNIMYNVNDYRPAKPGETEAQRKSFDNFIIVHTNYKGQLKAYSKRNFDPFCRRNRIRFYYEDNKYFVTTVGQLNFFKWALENNIIDYIQEHLKDIEDDMNLRCETVKRPGTKINPASIGGSGDETKKQRPVDGAFPIETQIKTRKNGGGLTRKKRKELSLAGSRSLSIHNVPTTLIFD